MSTVSPTTTSVRPSYSTCYTYRGKETARNVSAATTENYDPQHPANTIKTHTYCDGLGRTVQTRHEAEVQGVEKLVVSGHTVFDGLGRAVATYHPTEAHRDSTRFAFVVDAITPATAVYDVLDRPLLQTAPDGSTTRTAYGFSGSHLNKMLFRTAVTDPNGHTSTTLKDADGRQWATKVAGQPWLYCDYSPVGDLLAVYSSNNGDWSRAYEYDWLGRRTLYNEDNLATYYTYDGLNPATETHIWQENGQPLNRTITCRYTAHRLDSVIYSDSTLPTVYSYDYAGRVASVLDESGRMDYAYGSMGEVTAETRTYALPFLATDLALTTQYEYDSWGRTKSVTYPDGEIVNYDYDLGGQLKKVWSLQFGVYSYLDSVLYDKFGAVTSRKYGNGLKMQYAYHPQNRRLTAISTYNGNSQLSNTAYTYDAAGNITQAVSSYPWLAGQTFTETFSYDSTNQLVSAANAQTYALSVTYGDWGKIQQYGLSQTDLASNVATSQTRYYSYGSLNEGQTTFAPNSINYADGTNVNEQYGINGSLQRRETTRPGSQPETEHYRFTANGNLQAYMYENLLYVHYGYNAANTRTYKYSFDLNPNWVNGRLEAVNFNPHTAMFYPNSYLNFNNNGYYTKHYYNGMERIASRLGDQNLPIHTNDPELQDRKDQLDSNIRRNIADITGYEFLPVGEEQNHEDPKPVFELPQVGITGLQPISSGSVYYYHGNHLGSTAFVTDQNQTVVQGFFFAPFGEITNEHNSSFGSSVIPKYSFNAKELDEETGMYYYEARYYAPPTFTSRDPHFERYPTFSPYTYCANNPVKYVDPDGRDTINVNLNKGTIELIKADGDHRIFYYKNGKLAGTDQILKDKCFFHRVSYDIPYTEDGKKLEAHNEHLLCSNSDFGERIFRKIVEIGSPVEWDYYSMKDGHGDLSSSGIVNRMVHYEKDYTVGNVNFWNHYHPDEAENGFYPSDLDQDHARDLKGARCTLFYDGRSLDFSRYVKPKAKSYFSINYFKFLWERFAR